ncbi:DUF3081 family protein [Parendozoicomonas haliclonae]|uniref:DUF3081 domain-containing protein n=1 Tax=Parendozoicomonas haliclonae TaxID=1960125 RepID=A0A1X7AHG7_9GAMM|nr:DUF3081 family protein [Parendozoicomonas haliclonae]SMA41746.1 hypothetical protein EHSB41UT_01318 [Parendozoicomonas haliclonae]
MDHVFDIRDALRVYEIITEKGQKDGDAIFYKGFFAETSFDGYTVVLRDQKTKLTIGFHDTFRFDAPSSDAQNAFITALLTLAEES